MSPVGQLSTLDQEIFTFNGHVDEATYEWRSSHQQGSIGGFVDFVAEGNLEYSIFLFTLSMPAFQNGPVVPGSSEGRSPNFTQGGADYLGDLVAYDEVSHQDPFDDENPRIAGYLDGPAFSVFLAPLGTTEQMIRTNNQNAIFSLVNQQAVAQGNEDASSQSAFRGNNGGFGLQASVPAFCCFGHQSPADIPNRQSLNETGPILPVPEPSVFILVLIAFVGYRGIHWLNRLVK
jgi:hypothetical protein